MSAFSRGSFLKRQIPFTTFKSLRIVLLPKSCQRPRPFASATVLRAVKKSRPIPGPKAGAPLQIKPSSASNKAPAVKEKTPVYQTFASLLAQKQNPSLLYLAPPHTLFIVSSYSAALFCLSYAGISFYFNCLDAPADLATWVPIAFGGICFMMAAFGGWLILGPARLIKSISAVPARLAPSGAGRSKNTSPAAASPELLIEVELRKMFPLPFFPARKLYARPEDVVIPSRLAPVEAQLSAGEKRARQLREDAENKRKLEYERSHIMTAPFRHMSRAFYEVFKAIGRTWSREGFMKFRVKGQAYKLDVTGGWALDGGRALDRLVMVNKR